MYFTSLLFALALQVPELVHSQGTTSTQMNSWHPPGKGDVRGPCPGLNTLANHGFLPRDGKAISTNRVLTAIFDGFHIEREAMILPAHLAMLSSPSEDTFTLENIRLHNTFEHDVSVSRQDSAQGDNFSFNATIFETLANSNPGVNYYNATSAGQVQKQRLIDQRIVNPGLLNTLKELTLRSRESALYLASMGDPDTGVAPKEFVQTLFREERLPYQEGWQKPVKPITLDQLKAIGQAVVASSDWPGPGPGTVSPSVVFVETPTSTVLF